VVAAVGVFKWLPARPSDEPGPEPVVEAVVEARAGDTPAGDTRVGDTRVGDTRVGDTAVAGGADDGAEGGLADEAPGLPEPLVPVNEGDRS